MLSRSLRVGNPLFSIAYQSGNCHTDFHDRPFCQQSRTPVSKARENWWLMKKGIIALTTWKTSFFFLIRLRIP
jgi:hypothetical protein